MIAMPMVVAVDGGAGNLIADEQDHGLEQVDKRSLRSLTRPQSLRQPREQKQHDAGQEQLENHVLRDAEARFLLVQAVERAERLRNQDLAVHCLVELGHVCDVGPTLPEKLGHLVERPPVLRPQRLGDLEKKGVLEVVDRVVVGHDALGSCRTCRRLVSGKSPRGIESVRHRPQRRQITSPPLGRDLDPRLDMMMVRTISAASMAR